MIDSLFLKNFQCHESFKVEFYERITTIVGPSDVGKSSILRALRWVYTNKPSGKAFLRHGSTKPARVSLHVVGHTVSRIRGEGRNVFKFDDKLYQSFGSGVPEDVVSFLALGPENFQSQHDPVFWFSLSPGEVSRELNGIVNLGLIDSTLADLASQLRKSKTKVELTEERLKKAKEEETRLSWTKKADKELKIIERIEESLEERAGRIARLGRLLDDLGRLSLAVKKAKAILPLAQRVKELWEKKMLLQSQRDRLLKLVEEWHRLLKVSHHVSVRLGTIEDQMKRLLKDGCPLCGRKDK